LVRFISATIDSFDFWGFSETGKIFWCKSTVKGVKLFQSMDYAENWKQKLSYSKRH